MREINAMILTYWTQSLMLSPITLKFLEAVKINNNTERMHRNHDLYVQERKRFTELVEHLIIDMQKIDPNLNWIEVKNCIYRFNKDLRFLQTNLTHINYIFERFCVVVEENHHYHDIMFTFNHETIPWYDEVLGALVKMK